jgi:hypothetical protein
VDKIIYVTAPRPPHNPLGTAALVLGIISMCLAWIPCLGLLVLPVAVLGIVLGLLAILYGLLPGRGKIFTAMVGTGLSVLAAVVCLAMSAFLAHIAANAH